MKKAFLLSILLHLVVISIYVQMIDIKKDKKKEDVFYADILKPDIIRKEDPDTSVQAKRSLPSSKVPSRKGTVRSQKDPTNVKKPKERNQDIAKADRSTDDAISKPSLPAVPLPSVPSDPTIPTPKTEEKRDLRDRLFDRNILRDIAKTTKPDIKKDDSITFDTKEFKYHGYLRRLKDRIEGVWRYPQEAAERGVYGDLYIKFTIKKNGRLGDVQLMRTSGHRLLDEAALKALRDADPFWPLPDELGRESFTITGHFVYSIYGIHLR
ncbi:MAG: energy transducer TonB [Thermodesulfovibrionales bacterium]